MRKNLSKFIYSQFSSFEIAGVRLGGPGLGNLFFPWARAQIAARDTGFPLISSTWPALNPKRLLRKDSDRRWYGGMFLHEPESIKGLTKQLILSTHKKINEQDRNRKAKGIICFRGMQGLFTPIMAEYEYIKNRLMQITRPDILEIGAKSTEDYIAIHVRLGDFSPASSKTANFGSSNTRTPLDWYIRALKQMRETLPVKARIYSDGSPEELAPLLSEPDTELGSSGHPLIDLLQLSNGKGLIGSGSTYSMWASYLGRMPVIWPKGQMKQPLYSDPEKEKEL